MKVSSGPAQTEPARRKARKNPFTARCHTVPGAGRTSQNGYVVPGRVGPIDADRRPRIRTTPVPAAQQPAEVFAVGDLEVIESKFLPAQTMTTHPHLTTQPERLDAHRPRVSVLLALLAAAWGAAPLGILETRAAAPSVLPNASTYLGGEDIVVAFANGPGNPKDWIGVYPPEEIPDGSPASTGWRYVDGTTAGRTGLTEGTVAFPGGLNLTGEKIEVSFRNGPANPKHGCSRRTTTPPRPASSPPK